jgi:DNA-binding transcriptional MerR regulator
MVSPHGVFSIGALSRVLGVPASTLRAWEERYRVVVPDRSAGGQRLYSRDDLERLRFVCTHVERGFSAADAHRLLSEQASAGVPLTKRVVDDPYVHIVLVERDPYAAELVEYFLRTEGYAVDTARTIAVADDVLAHQRSDLIVLDLMIEAGAGLHWCEHAHDVTHVLAVAPFDLRDRALALGADAFIRKPFDSLELVSAVRDLLGTSALTRRAPTAAPA